ncbi:MAG: helix-turn-helix domain-containing protein [Lachnospiraceae bacterium]
METKDIIVELRKKNGLSQDELAKKVMVTRHEPVIIGLN